MTALTASAAPARRLVLVPSSAPRAASAALDPRVRRYRIGRITDDGRRPRPAVLASTPRSRP